MGFGFWVLGSVFCVQGFGSRVQGSRFRDQDSGFQVQGSRLKVQGSSSRVPGLRHDYIKRQSARGPRIHRLEQNGCAVQEGLNQRNLSDKHNYRRTRRHQFELLQRLSPENGSNQGIDCLMRAKLS